jgi:hypothetical protein
MAVANITILDNTNQQQQPVAAPAPTKRSPAAERMRRHRARRRDGMRCVTLDLREAEIDRLVELGHLRPDDRENQNELMLALYRFLDQSVLCDPDRG